MFIGWFIYRQWDDYDFHNWNYNAGIGYTLGINPALTCGAIISGAMFGGKMSPISDTTNFLKLVNLLQLVYALQTGNQIIDSLLSRGGIDSMMESVFLIVMALALGGLLMRLKIIETAMNPLIVKLKTPAALIFATVLI